MPLSYFPETIPQARGDHVIAPTPGRGKPGEAKPWVPGVGVGVQRGDRKGRGGAPTDLVEELGQLHLHLLALEHVVLGLLADGRDQVELPGHRVGLLRMQRGCGGPCPAVGVGAAWASGRRHRDAPGKATQGPPLPPLGFPGSLLGPRHEVGKGMGLSDPKAEGVEGKYNLVERLGFWHYWPGGLGQEAHPSGPQFPHVS